MHLINTRLGAEQQPTFVRLKGVSLGHPPRALAALSDASFGRTMSYRMQSLQQLKGCKILLLLGFRTYTCRPPALSLLGTSAVTHQGDYEVCRALPAMKQGCLRRRTRIISSNKRPWDTMHRTLTHGNRSVTHARHELMQRRRPRQGPTRRTMTSNQRSPHEIISVATHCD